MPSPAEQSTHNSDHNVVVERPIAGIVKGTCVIVPALDAVTMIGDCLDALLADGFDAGEIVVVDDGSADGTGDAARARGVRVLRNAVPQGPARARNRGAAEAGGAVLLFVDADVVIHKGVRDRLAGHFGDPGLTAVIGSYDDRPAAPSVISRYRNLLHHVTHQEAAGPAMTFWSGLGAVRRAAFDGLGGFDPAWEIEDVELGLRITEGGGRILLDPDLQGTHLKEWTLRSMVRTDMVVRAIPWARLMRAGRLPVGVLNTGLRHRVSAAAVALGLLSLVAGLAFGAALWLALACLGAFLWANAGLMRRLARIGGPAFAVGAMPYHAVHYVAALAGYGWVRLFENGKP